MKDQHYTTVKDALSSWVHWHEAFNIAVSDHGRNVDGEKVNEFCQKIGAEKRRSSPYHPEGDGLAERSTRSVKTLIRYLVAERNLPKSD